MNESHYMFVYWILGAFFDDIETLTLAVGLLRSFESVGSCLSFGKDKAYGQSYRCVRHVYYHDTIDLCCDLTRS
jgi:hypothetical protein